MTTVPHRARTWRAAAAAGVLALGGSLTAWQPEPARAAGTRATVVIGDLHMGPGRDEATGEWSPREDFRWHGEFSTFLDAVAREGGNAVDLVLNGDVFDLWPPAVEGCAGDEDSGCEEGEAVTRLERVMRQHRDTIERLAAFSSTGSNRVVVVPGHQDAALLFPAVGRRLEDVVTSSGGRVTLAREGGWWSEDGAVYVEHGHQLPRNAYRLDGWPRPFVLRGGRPAIVRSPGERLLRRLYDRLEPRYPIVDNVAEEGAGVRYVASVDPSALQSGDAVALARILLSKPTWPQFRTDLEETIRTPPAWDLSAIRAQGARFLLDGFAQDDPIRPWLEQYVALDGADGLPAMSDEELVSICDYRAAVRRARRRMERGLTQMTPTGRALRECPRTPETVGAAFGYFWRSRDRDVLDRLGELSRAVSPEARKDVPRAYVHGHTHVADRGFDVEVDSVLVRVVNAGAWQRTIVPAALEELKIARGWSNRDAFERLSPDDLPACYGFVWIAAYADRPRPTVRFWQRDGEGRWGFADRCA